MAKGTGVSSRHRDYDKYAKKWRKCRDVCAGQDNIHEAGVLYLSMLKEQDATEYMAYVKRTPFYNATWRTVAGFIGMLFRKPATLEVPAELEKLLLDVTMSGVSFNAFAQDCALENLTVSRLGVLVDHPTQIVDAEGNPVALTIADTERLGIRPSMQQYKAENIIDWRFGYVNNHHVLTQVRLLEEFVIEKNEFETETENRIKVLDLVDGKYRMRVFREQDEEQIGGDVYPVINDAALTEIPFYFIGPDGTEATLTEPILVDLVDLNLKHYSVSADYEHGCHMTGLPTPVISGYKTQFNEAGQAIPAKFYIGSTTAWVFPDAETTATYLEFQGQGLQSLENNLNRKEAQMAAIGARMLSPEKSGVEAAETLAMRHSGENSVLSAIAIAVSDGLAKALAMFAKWANINGPIKFEINRDFVPMSVDGVTLTAWLALVQAGQMSGESLFDLLKRADMIDPDLKYEEEQARIDANPPAPPIGHNGGPSLDDEGNDDEEGKTPSGNSGK
jgi:hypothetical protein